MKRSFKQDYTYGKKQEVSIRPTLELFFKEILYETTNFCPYDFRSDTRFFEVKSRPFEHSKFPTTLLPCSKAREDLICIFNFTDGIYYIPYNPTLFATFERKSFCRKKRSDYNDKPADYWFIPISALLPINYS